MNLRNGGRALQVFSRTNLPRTVVVLLWSAACVGVTILLMSPVAQFRLRRPFDSQSYTDFKPFSWSVKFWSEGSIHSQAVGWVKAMAGLELADPDKQATWSEHCAWLLRGLGENQENRQEQHGNLLEMEEQGVRFFRCVRTSTGHAYERRQSHIIGLKWGQIVWQDMPAEASTEETARQRLRAAALAAAGLIGYLVLVVGYAVARRIPQERGGWVVKVLGWSVILWSPVAICCAAILAWL